MWENSCGGCGSCGAETGSRAGGRSGSLAASWSGDWEPGVRAWECSIALTSSGAFSMGLSRQRRKINKSVLAYHAPYGQQTVRQTLGAGWVLFRLSLGIFFFFSLSLFQSPFFFFPFSFSLEVFIPYMVISICHTRLLGLTPASQASCVVPCFVPFPAQMGPPGCTEFCDKPRPPGGARSVLRASLWSAELRPFHLLP